MFDRARAMVNHDVDAAGPSVLVVSAAVWFLTVMLPLLGLAAPTSGQERIVLRGHVVDAASQEPLQGVRVTAPLSELSVLTDSLGDFSVSFIRDWGYELVAGAVGYQPVRITLGPEAEQGSTTIQLHPDPEALAGLAVLHDRLEQRRRRRSNRIRLMEHDELALSTESSAYALVRRMIPGTQPCENQRDLCRLGRSRVRICIDDVSPSAGARELEAYEPSDLWLIEVYNNGGRVRVYSRWFIDQIARTKQGEIRPNPIC